MRQPSPPRVQLVGAGPGSADLLTLRALRAIEGAEALLYDALVCDDVLAVAPQRCLKILTGKRSGGVSMKQAEINALMLKLALNGLKVVRLKAGDPSVFGRSGEERDHLEAHGVQVEIVPGITAASAAAAQFAFPLTHRKEARRVIFATARVEDGAVLETGWAACADAETTLALYMSRDAAGPVCARLIAEGRAPSTPAIAVENAGRPDARLLRADLATLPQALASTALTGAVLLIIGKVALRAAGPDRAPRQLPPSAPINVTPPPARTSRGRTGHRFDGPRRTRKTAPGTARSSRSASEPTASSGSIQTPSARG